MIGLVVRSAGAGRELDVAELTGFEDPKKLSGGNSKVRVVFDVVNGGGNQSAFLRPQGNQGEDGAIDVGAQVRLGISRNFFCTKQNHILKK